MNIPNHFDIEQKLLSDKSSRCNKVMLKLYYMIVCFLKSFVLIALALAIIMILFKQIGVEIEFEKLVKMCLKIVQLRRSISNSYLRISNQISQLEILQKFRV